MKTMHRIITGDSRKMQEVKDASVHLIVTSPPYWQLKDYGSSDQIGFNHSYEEYINNLEYLSELVIRDRRTDTLVSHREIGVGVSQVLPVLVAAYASKHSIIAIEQPEIHLHPALQAELGDVFIQSALGSSRNTFLLETHSEHLILRIMRRMRNTANEELPDGMPKITPDDVAIIYVQPKDDHSAAIVQHLELDEEGGFIDPWPGGFFEEGFNERFA